MLNFIPSSVFLLFYVFLHFAVYMVFVLFSFCFIDMLSVNCSERRFRFGWFSRFPSDQ